MVQSGEEPGAVAMVMDAVDSWDKRVSYSMYLGNSPLATLAMPICKVLE
jgi:hypothetical protein